MAARFCFFKSLMRPYMESEKEVHLTLLLNVIAGPDERDHHRLLNNRHSVWTAEQEAR
jgi:hypothetical protein